MKDRIIRLVAEQRGVDPETITEHTTLLGDLGCDGDDALELIENYQQLFQVDMTGYDHSLHFGGEGMHPWTPLVWIGMIFRKGTPEEKAHLIPITVEDLATAAQTKKWPTRRCSRRFGLSRSVRGTARAIPPRG